MSLTNDIKKAIGNNIKSSINGMQVNEFVASQISPPACDIRRGPVNYDQSFTGGIHSQVILVRVFVASTMDRAAQALLDSYIDPDSSSSVKEAIESDRSLGGLVADLHVSTASGEQTYSMANQAQLIGSEWTVNVLL